MLSGPRMRSNRLPSLQARLDALRIRRDPLLRPDRTARRGARGPLLDLTRRPSGPRPHGRIASIRLAAASGNDLRRVPTASDQRGDDASSASVRGGRVLAASELMLLAEMVEAGVRLDRALGSLERASTNPGHRRALARMRTSVEGGRTLTDVIVDMDVTPSVRALIAGAERIGRLGDGLRAAAELTSRLAAVRRQIRSAMAYPAIVLVVAVLVLVIVSVSVVPQMERTFVDLGGELPRATRIVVGVAGVIRSPWVWVTLIGASATWGAARTGHLGLNRGRFQGRGPSRGWSPLRRLTDTAVAARVIATLLTNDATVVDAFATAGGSAVHPAVRAHLLELAAITASGRPIAETEAVRWLFHTVEQEMLAVGEERGLFAEQWGRIADRRIAALERRLALFGTLAEPVLVIIVGLIVGGTVTALYLPSMKVLELI